MSTASTGHGSALTLTTESTWGTDNRGVGTTYAFDIESVGGDGIQYMREPLPILATGSRTERGSYLGEIRAGFEVVLPVTWRSFGVLLQYALGAAGVTTGASAPYTHTFTPAQSLPTGLTAEVIMGTSGTSKVYTGCMISKLVLKVDAGGAMMATVTFIAKSCTEDASPSTPSFGSGRDMLVDHQSFTEIVWGALTAITDRVQSLTITIDNALSRRNRLGSAETARPYFSGFADFTLEAELDAVAADDILTAVADPTGTPADCVISFENPADADDTIEITLTGAIATSFQAGQIGGPDILKSSIALKGQTSGSDKGIAVVLTNASSTANG